VSDEAFDLAEFNISRLKAPLDDPSIKEFVDFLEPVNAFAEQILGLVWRLTAAEDQDAPYLPSAHDDPLVSTSLTVWTGLDRSGIVENLFFETVHRFFLQSRRKWFERALSKQLVMWWLLAGAVPTLEEAKQKLLLLAERGPAAACAFHDAFDPTGHPVPRSGRQQLGNGGQR
jgi:hypothetical protein